MEDESIILGNLSEPKMTSCALCIHLYMDISHKVQVNHTMIKDTPPQKNPSKKEGPREHG